MTTFTNNDHHTPGEKLRLMSHHQPAVSIFLQPIAPPAALGLAGFAGSTWITASWIANWWGSPDSPSIFFPFVAFFGGLAQFIAGLYGFHARDTLVSVINTMWGSFWISVGLLYLLVATKVLPSHSIYTQFPELASWFVILAVFTWSGVCHVPPICPVIHFALTWIWAGYCCVRSGPRSCRTAVLPGNRLHNCLLSFLHGRGHSSRHQDCRLLLDG
jgi:succinate-acetate transporter protein